jgi:hypothetical protein
VLGRRGRKNSNGEDQKIVDTGLSFVTPKEKTSHPNT